MVSPWIPALWLALTAMQVVVNVSLHGQPKNTSYDGPTAFLAAVFLVALAWWGGFFSPLREWM